MRSPDLVSQCSLSEIAKHLQVGEATLVRFCRTIGFKGFSEFKLELSIELATKDNQDESILETEIMPSDDSLTIAQKLQTAVANVMEETINLFDLKQLEEVVKVLKKKHAVFFFLVWVHLA